MVQFERVVLGLGDTGQRCYSFFNLLSLFKIKNQPKSQKGSWHQHGAFVSKQRWGCRPDPRLWNSSSQTPSYRHFPPMPFAKTNWALSKQVQKNVTNLKTDLTNWACPRRLGVSLTGMSFKTASVKGSGTLRAIMTITVNAHLVTLPTVNVL